LEKLDVVPVAVEVCTVDLEFVSPIILFFIEGTPKHVPILPSIVGIEVTYTATSNSIFSFGAPQTSTATATGYQFYQFLKQLNLFENLYQQFLHHM